MSRRTLLAFAFALVWLPALGTVDGDDYDQYTIRLSDIPKDAPSFKDYPVQPYAGTNAAPDVRSDPRSRMYRTQLRGWAREKPNFAGHYILATWGCGTSCTQIAVIDVLTGKVFHPPGARTNSAVNVHDELLIEEDSSPRRADFGALRYRADSRLLILIGMPENRVESRGISYFVWENDGLRKIRFVPKAFGLSCIEPQRVSCGCSIRVVGIDCRSSNHRQTHFFSELHQGAPLWMNYSGREFSIPSVKPVEPVFYRSKGDSWSEEYRAGDMTVIIRYRAAGSTCPADKGADGCEYFDVAAEIMFKANDNTHKYSGHGSCGC